ncbi:MAG: PqqD family protein [bacterium]
MHKYSISMDILEQKFEDSIIIFVSEENKFYMLEGTSIVIWEFLKRAKTMEEIEKLMYDKYEVKKSKLRNDIINLMDYLIDAKILLLK